MRETDVNSIIEAHSKLVEKRKHAVILFETVFWKFSVCHIRNCMNI